MDILIPHHDLAWRLQAFFAGGLPPYSYLSPDIRRADPGWGGELFNRQIESLELHLPTGHKIVLGGMEQYNFFVEAIQGPGCLSPKIKAFWLAGKPPESNIVELWRISGGKVVRTRKIWGREWCGGPTSGWRSGSIGSPPVSRLES
jgi:hypothetical protein